MSLGRRDASALIEGPCLFASQTRKNCVGDGGDKKLKQYWTKSDF